MFERFTRPARTAITAAVEEAERRRDRHIGTEHLLIGLARSDAPVTTAALRELGIDPSVVRATLAEEDRSALAAAGIDIDPWPDVDPQTTARLTPRRGSGRDHRPFTDGAKHVLNGALVEARSMGHRRLGTEHILLSLLQQPSVDPALRLLHRLGTKPHDLRCDVRTRMSQVEP